MQLHRDGGSLRDPHAIKINIRIRGIFNLQEIISAKSRRDHHVDNIVSWKI